MGDDRARADDSRRHTGTSGGGMVPVSDVIGRVVLRYWPPTGSAPSPCRRPLPTGRPPRDPARPRRGPGDHDPRAQPPRGAVGPPCPRPREPDDGGSGALAAVGAAVREFVIVVAMALVLSFVVKTWLFQAFYIPSGSMEDTLLINDRVIVNKLVPEPDELHRGDVVVFKDPGGWLPPVPRRPTRGDRRAIVYGADLRRSAARRLRRPPHQARHRPARRPRRLLHGPGQAHRQRRGDHRALRHARRQAEHRAVQHHRSAGRIWVMGDHRSDSEDSRYHDPAGTGPRGRSRSPTSPDARSRSSGRSDHLSWLSDYPRTFAEVPNPGSAGASSRSTPTTSAQP